MSDIVDSLAELKKTIRADIKNQAKKYLDVKHLFPRSRMDGRTEFSKYQADKIVKAIAAMHENFGADFKNLVPLGRGHLKYNREHGLPAWVRGVPLSGGTKQNKNATYIAGELRYKRGTKESPRAIIPIDTDHGEEGVIRSVKEGLKKRAGRDVTATANNKAIGSIIPQKDEKLFLREVLYNFNKYDFAANAANGSMTDKVRAMLEAQKFVIIGNSVWRDRGKPHGLTLVAKPSEWGMGMMFEGEPRKPRTKKRGRK